MKPNAPSSLSSGTFHATRAPSARFVAKSVWRTRLIVPAFNMALIRCRTSLSSTPDSLAISLKGSRTNPWIRSSATARILELTASVCSVSIIKDKANTEYPGARLLPSLRRTPYLYGLLACFVGPDPNRFFDGIHEDLSIADFAGLRRLYDCCRGVFHHAVRKDDLDLDLWQKVDGVFTPTIDFCVAFLTTKPFYFCNRHSLDPEVG